MTHDVAGPSVASGGSAMRYASVCDGIGAAHVAWQPLGWQCQWTSEIEPFPAAVVEHHYGFRNLGDMTAITEEMLDAPVDLLVGGTPCQSFSVAGLRKGLDDPRGNLALRFVQLASVMQPKWIVWENVPGVLSSGKGRDFGTFLGALGELGYGFAYRVLDAQWFGVAQRRRRVFVVGYLGDWRRAAAVLFERESVFGNPPTRGATWEGVARSTAASLTSSGRGVERCGESRGQDDVVLAAPQVANPLTARMGKGINTTCDEGQTPVIAFGGQMSTPQVDVELSQTLQRKNPQAVATTFDWQAGGGGSDTRATTVVAIPINADSDRQNSSALTPSPDAEGRVRLRDPGVGIGGDGDPMFTMQATKPHAVAYAIDGYSNQPAWMTGDRTDCLPSSGHSDGSHQGVGVVSVVNMGGDKGGASTSEDGSCFTLSTNEPHAVSAHMAVRRLTPRECERLQGFPSIREQITITACLDRQNCFVSVALSCRRWQSNASPADANVYPQSANAAENDSSIHQADQERLAAVSVHTNSVDQLQEIRSHGKLIWSANSAGESGEFHLQVPSGDIAAELAQAGRILALETRTGKAESLQNIRLSFQASRGAENALKYGNGIAESASGAKSDATAEKFTTSELGQLASICDSPIATSLCSALRVISGCIPSETLTEHFSLEFDIETPYTLVTYRNKPAADGPRYRALGNSMAVPVMRWIGERIQAVDSL